MMDGWPDNDRTEIETTPIIRLDAPQTRYAGGFLFRRRPLRSGFASTCQAPVGAQIEERPRACHDRADDKSEPETLFPTPFKVSPRY